MQILIVEDDRRLARQLKKGLDELGHAATTAFDGTEGLAAAEAGEFDVIVLDVMLPGLDGLSVVHRFRRHGGDTPVLLLTARDTPEDVIGGLDAGADDYLTKPFSFKILEARLRALARRKRVEPRTRLKIDDLVLDPPRGKARDRANPVVANRVRTIGIADAKSKPGPHPNAPDRSRLGPRSRRAEQHPRRVHPATPIENR